MALVSGRSPVRLLDEGAPDIWTELDLDVVSQWKHLKEAKCPGCGRPLSQHLYNSRLGREETVEDYAVWSVDCPSRQAIAHGQAAWRSQNENAIKAYQKGDGPDPNAGIYWLSQGQGERIPTPEQE